MTEVDVESLEPLLAKLADEAPLGTRVVGFIGSGSIHYLLDQHGWKPEMEVVA